MEKIIAAMMGMSFMATLLLIAFIVMWIKSIVDVINNDFKDQTNKIIWIIMLIVIPPIGTILYLTIGKKQKEGEEEQEYMITDRKPSKKRNNEPKAF